MKQPRIEQRAEAREEILGQIQDDVQQLKEEN